MQLILQRRYDKYSKRHAHIVIVQYIATRNEQRQVNEQISSAPPIVDGYNDIHFPNTLTAGFKFGPLPDAGLVERLIWRYNRNPMAVTNRALFLGSTLKVRLEHQAIEIENALHDHFTKINQKLEQLNGIYRDVVLEYDPDTQSTRPSKRS